MLYADFDTTLTIWHLKDFGSEDLDDFIVDSDESDPENPKKKPVKRPRARQSARPAGSEAEEEDFDIQPVRERGANDKQHKISFRKFLPSAKMRKAMLAVKALPAEDKAIIISQFTSALDLMGPYLKENHIRYCCFDGRMSMSDKDISVSKFKRDPSIKVMLLSLRAGGVGLNLVVANHCYNLDPAYNVSVTWVSAIRTLKLHCRLPPKIRRSTGFTASVRRNQSQSTV